MGQYWIAVNLDKKEYVSPHKLKTGAKLWEQLANHPGTGAALVILIAAQREMRGGGDLQENTKDENYNKIARSVIGRWAGNRVAFVGDYAEDNDLPEKFKASRIHDECNDGKYLDISDHVATVIEHELSE